MKINVVITLIIAFLLLSGCSPQQSDTKTEDQEKQIEELEKEIADLRQTLQKTEEAFRESTQQLDQANKQNGIEKVGQKISGYKIMNEGGWFVSSVYGGENGLHLVISDVFVAYFAHYYLNDIYYSELQQVELPDVINTIKKSNDPINKNFVIVYFKEGVYLKDLPVNSLYIIDEGNDNVNIYYESGEKIYLHKTTWKSFHEIFNLTQHYISDVELLIGP